MCDDDNISPVSSQEILKLSGGGEFVYVSFNYKVM